jgi:hypothetical protein
MPSPQAHSAFKSAELPTLGWMMSPATNRSALWPEPSLRVINHWIPPTTGATGSQFWLGVGDSRQSAIPRGSSNIPAWSGRPELGERQGMTEPLPKPPGCWQASSPPLPHKVVGKDGSAACTGHWPCWSFPSSWTWSQGEMNCPFQEGRSGGLQRILGC